MAVRLYGRATISWGTISLGYMAVQLHGRFENSPESVIFFGFMAAKRPIFSKIPLISLGFMAEFGTFCRIFWLRNDDFVCIHMDEAFAENLANIHVWCRKI